MPDVALKTYGAMGVDWEERVNYDRLRNDRLARIKKLLKQSDFSPNRTLVELTTMETEVFWACLTAPV